MKAALVILHADASRGGAERYTLDLADALARGGHDVSLAALSFGHVPDGVSKVPLASQGITRTGRYRQFLDALDAHLDATSYDVVHAMLPVRRCDVYHPHAGLAAEAVSGLAPAMEAVLNPRRLAFAHVERQLLHSPKPPIVLCLSEYIKATVRRFYPLPDNRLATLFNAVDVHRFVPAEPQPRSGTVRALMVAQDFIRKGLREAIEALAKLGEPRLHLTVVGRPRREPFVRLAQRLGVERQVTFAGPTNDVRPFYAAADFFVLPTRHDPCSLVVLEALAMGVPVISTRFNGACEVMTHGTHGFVLDDPRDVQSLARSMDMMLDDVRRTSMRRACLELRPRLSYDEHVRTLVGIYHGIADRRLPAD